MEKKTFNDMMANLPTTETDMTRVMVEMEDGRKGWISAEGLAQVMAGLMPVATAEKQGVMSAAMAQKVLPLISKTSQQKENIFKIRLDKKYNVLIGAIRNFYAPCLIHLYKRSSAENNPGVSLISCPLGKMEMYVDNSTFYINVGQWGEISVLALNGNVGTIDLVSTIPDTAIKVE